MESFSFGCSFLSCGCGGRKFVLQPGDMNKNSVFPQEMAGRERDILMRDVRNGGEGALSTDERGD